MNELYSDSAVKPNNPKSRDLWIILIANGLFALLTNVFFLFDGVHPFRSSHSLWTPLLVGIGVYGVQCILIWYLVNRYFASGWLSRPLKAKDWFWGFGIGLLVWGIANIVLAYRLPDHRLYLNSSRSFYRFFRIFLFNSLPGALIEEYLFRFLPVQFVENQGYSRRKTVLIFLTVLMFFTATHIPAYLWQYNISMWSLWSPFTMGAAFLFVYYATRNLPFTALFHAFTNQSWMIVGPTNIKDYSLVIVLSVIWFVIRSSRANSLS